MKFVLGVIASVGFLVAVILGMIAMDPGYLASPAQKADGTICTMEWNPMCGANGITYGNLCMLEASGTELDYAGECIALVSEPEPAPEPVACTKEWMPMCGVDGNTYGNKCMLDASGIALDYEGECVVAEPEPAEPEQPTAMPLPPQTHNVSIPEGVSMPGCETSNECFIPYTLSIFLGDTVSWSNDDTAAHTVTSGTLESGPTGLFDSGLFMADGIYEYTFSEVGEYDYFCLVHPWMTGKVIVNPPAQDVVVEPEVSEPEPVPEEPAENPGGITEERRAGPPEVVMTPGSGSPGCEANLECYIPHTLMIDSGEVVIWINSDSAAHTVTSGVMPAGHDGKFDSGLIMAGNTWEHGFTESGEYDYYCMVHPWMTGKVIVS